MASNQEKQGQRPGTDITDPKVLAGAQRVATRRNNDAKRKLDEERAALPLFASEIPSRPEHKVTAFDVIARRILCQQAAWENGSERDIAEIEKLTAARNEVFGMVSEDEYTKLYAASLEWSFAKWAYWYNVKDGILRRAEPMTPDAELVLTWLADWEGEPPTIGELHAKRGDGMAREQISEALDWLERRRYIEGHQIRPCKYAAERLKDLGIPGLSAPYTVTEGGRTYLGQQPHEME